MFEVEEWQSISRQEDELVCSLFGEFATKRSKKQNRKEPKRFAGSRAKGTTDYETEKREEVMVGTDQSASGKKKKKAKRRAEALLEGFEQEHSRKIKKLIPRHNVQDNMEEEDGSELSARHTSSEIKRKKRNSNISGNIKATVEPKQDEHADHLQTANTAETKEDKSKKAKRKQRQEERGVHVEGEGEFQLCNTHVDTDVPVKKLDKEVLRKPEKSNIKKTKKKGSTVDECNHIQGKQPTLRNELVSSSKSVFQEKLMRKLESSRFRWINEQLYTSKGCEAMDMFSDDPSLFDIYHRGFKAQVHQWPVNPADVITQWLKERPSSLVVADFGCGEATIAQSISNKVHSFDLVAVNEQVTACNMSKVPLPDSSVDVAVFCLSLMGTNLVDYLQEAHRVLRAGGTLKIAEVVSRIEDTDVFVSSLSKLGFQAQKTDTSNKMFVIFELLKSGSGKQKSLKTGLKGLQLKPCIYKRR